jgi:hypothetical protein
MKKQNCWEFKKCGREPGGKKVEKLGVCPAAKPGEGSGVNHGKYQGRICWAVAGTFCEGEIKGSFAKGTHTCLTCDFYRKVVDEEDDDFNMLLPLPEEE